MNKKDQRLNIILNRYCITGLLKTVSPLHIGSGTNRYITAFSSDSNTPKEVPVRAVPTDYNNKPYIPGASLRGILRAITENMANSQFINDLWGISKNDSGEADNEAVGGKVIVHDAYFSTETKLKDTPLFEKGERHWNPERWTYIQHACAINRFTKTAAEHQLFYEEVIPPGSLFEINIDIKDNDRKGLELILLALESFSKENNIMPIGGDKSSGYGQCIWLKDRAKITGLESKNDIQQWLQSNNACGFQGFPTIEIKSSNNFKPYDSKAISIEMILTFDGPMVINDPTIWQLAEKSKDSSKSATNVNPIHNEKKKPFIPAQSLKGVIRTQAERILRTIAENCQPGLSANDLKKIACYPTQKMLACKPLETKTELCIACTLFGASGWLSPICIHDLDLINDAREITQEFVAIDRFTGGGADQKKYSAKVLYKPVFKGLFSINLTQEFEQVKITDAHLGLLMLLFRDLFEKHIRLGYGTSKGYGSCGINFNCTSENIPEINKYDSKILADAFSLNWTNNVREHIVQWVQALEIKINDKLKG